MLKNSLLLPANIFWSQNILICSIFFLLQYVDSLYDDYLKKVPRMLDQYLSCQGATSSSYESQTLHQLNNVFSNLKKYHHEVYIDVSPFILNFQVLFLPGWLKMCFYKTSINLLPVNGSLLCIINMESKVLKYHWDASFWWNWTALPSIFF